MLPRLNLAGASRALSIRTRPLIASRVPKFPLIAPRRGFAYKQDAKPEATGPNQDVLGHVSEEAADVGKVTGETQPDLGQGTPVQEVLLLTKVTRQSSTRLCRVIRNESIADCYLFRF